MEIRLFSYNTVAILPTHMGPNLQKNLEVQTYSKILVKITLRHS